MFILIIFLILFITYKVDQIIKKDSQTITGKEVNFKSNKVNIIQIIIGSILSILLIKTTYVYIIISIMLYISALLFLIPLFSLEDYRIRHMSIIELIILFFIIFFNVSKGYFIIIYSIIVITYLILYIYLFYKNNKELF